MEKNMKIRLTLVATLFVFIMVSCSKPKDHVDMGELKTLKDSASYALGYLNGIQATQSPDASVNVDLYTKAFKQGYNKDTAGTWNEATMRSIIMEYARKSQEQMQQKAFEQAKPDIDRAEKFLAENKNRENIITTNSGLQYKVIKRGKGQKPVLNNGDRVILNYTMSILNEKGQFEQVQSTFNSEGKNPGPMGIDGQCEGIKEILSLMNAGARYQVWIHPNLGFGDSPKLQMYEIEVIKVLHEN